MVITIDDVFMKTTLASFRILYALKLFSLDLSFSSEKLSKNKEQLTRKKTHLLTNFPQNLKLKESITLPS